MSDIYAVLIGLTFAGFAWLELRRLREALHGVQNSLEMIVMMYTYGGGLGDKMQEVMRRLVHEAEGDIRLTNEGEEE